MGTEQKTDSEAIKPKFLHAKRLIIAPHTPQTKQGLRFALRVVQAGPVLIFVALIIVLSILEPLFFTPRNISNLAVQSSIVAILALGVFLVILTAGIDLSVGSVMALGTVTGAIVFHSLPNAGWLVAPVMVCTGAIIGLVNGLIFVKGKMPHPFIPTLAMLNAARGIALLISDGKPIPGLPDYIRWLGAGRIGPVPVPAILVVILVILTVLLTRITRWGRWIYAVGGNNEAARRLGIPVDKVLISVYVLAGVGAGFAAIVVGGRTNAGYPTAGQLAELDAIAAVIIGGASFFGGHGRVFNVLIGALILGSIRNGLNLLGVSAHWQLVIIGVVIVIAVLLDVTRLRLEGRFRTVQAEESEKGKPDENWEADE